MLAQAVLIALVAAPALARRTVSLGGTSLDRRDASCPATSPASCSGGSSPSGANSCCTNTPGGALLQTQFWDANPSTGPSNSWTVHGLWPDHCDGTYDASCDPNRAYTNISAILQNGGGQATLDYMRTYWPDYQGNDESFWSHEWSKHGTCISTLDPSCYGSSYVPQEEVVEYFQRVVSLFKSLPTYDWLSAAGIVPSTSTTYTLAQLQAVANARFGHDAVWNCASGSLDEVWWGYTSQGTIESGSFTPADPVGSKSTCPSTGIKYLPKSGGTATATATATTASPTNTAASGTPSGTVFINVIAGGSAHSCLISTGKWIGSGTCAGYAIKSVTATTFTMTTSKGPCNVSSTGTFSCASGLAATTFSVNSSNNLVLAGSANFFAPSVPSGQTQVDVSSKSGAQTIQLKYGPSS